MAPRFAFRASKFRNIECKQLPRESSYDQLQVTSAMVDGNVLAATRDRFAFPHQIDGGGAIQVKELADVGKDAVITPPLLRGHQNRVNSLEFSPFDTNTLFSGSADATVKVWKLPADAKLEQQLSATTTLSGASSTVSIVKCHPTANNVVAAVGQRDTLVFDAAAESVLFQHAVEDDGAYSGLCWNYNGSLLVASSLNQKLRLLDPRGATSVVNEWEGHAGRRRPTNVIWCGQRDHFLSMGSGVTQERELKLWDPRNLSTPVSRERLDTSIGQLFSLYDADVDLLYLVGKGDRSARCYELDFARAPFVHALDHSMLPHMTLASAIVPKQACDTTACEVARVLNLSASGGASGGICDVLSFRVPRKDALNEFQRDLYPDTRAFTAALSAEEWQRGQNADPVLETVKPTTNIPTDGGASSVFGGNNGAASAWGVPAQPMQSGWGATSSWGAPPTSAPAPAPASNGTSGLKSSSTSWNAPAPPPPPPQPVQNAWGGATSWGAPPSSAPTPATTSTGSSGWKSSGTTWNAPTSVAPQPITQWSTAPVASDSTTETTPEAVPTETPNASSTSTDSISNEASPVVTAQENSGSGRRLGATPSHKLKYIKGQQVTRNDVFTLGDRVPAFAGSGAGSSVIKANSKYWAVPLQGAGGPMLVKHLSVTGRATAEDPVLNGHKFTITDIDFHSFDSEILASGASDGSLSVWKLNDTLSNDDEPVHRLTGHTKGIRSVLFHPAASDVLCTTSQDLSVRLWDVEVGAERVGLHGKLEDSVWNTAFSPDGSLLATSSRDKIIRVFDPRSTSQALIAMGCGLDSTRPQFVSWLSTAQLFTLGTNLRNETTLQLWDARNLVDPLKTTALDCANDSSTTAYPFYDESSRVLFIMGLGARHIWSYELDFKDTSEGSKSSPVVHANLPFVAQGAEPISGAVVLPKALCDVRQVEIDRVLLLRKQTVERVSFTLPRADRLREYFQDDIYGPVRASRPSLSASQWFAGEEVVLEYDSLRPPDMVPLSEKPVETERRSSKSEYYRAKWEEEEREKQLKAAQYERLQSLAAQPSLHSKYQPQGQVRADNDSDDDWDD
ncbi:hypothetical protein Poli38472_005696 [Pythium oligandrum]|uniref:Coronin n=1 Tax=Pythium oligandrum TaxID=41045 RepID=A0A8K1CHH7_PYTOL|nr:hypothetical protein Poli38472_005696 [Pythium oligandrum]|eukprot:TMW63078.1 hypothetical protein Poli38472_005696 [Pythium oligandrum]